MLKQKINITQKDGKITVEGHDGNILYMWDIKYVVEMLKNGDNGTVDTVHLANSIAEVIHDSLAVEHISCTLHDDNDVGQYSNETATQFLGHTDKQIRGAMNTLAEHILENNPSHPLNKHSMIEPSKEFVLIYDEEDCFSLEAHNGKLYIVFIDELNYELPSVVLTEEGKVLSYNEYCELVGIENIYDNDIEKE